MSTCPISSSVTLNELQSLHVFSASERHYSPEVQQDVMADDDCAESVVMARR